MPAIIRQKDLTNYNSFGFQSTAEQYIKIESEQGLIQAIEYAKAQALPFHVLSGGSNVLVGDEVKGLTLHMAIKGYTLSEQVTLPTEGPDEIRVWVNAGEVWHDFVSTCVDRQWQGIETMALIPGLVGAAPVQNIGAYGTELCDVLMNVKAFDVSQNSFVILDREQCQFGYRDSLFKRDKGRYIITAIELKLRLKTKIVIKYRDLQAKLAHLPDEKISLRDVFQGICDIRRSKLPDPSEIGNAGSFFKNPVISEEAFTALTLRFENIVGYSTGTNQVKLAAGWLIDQCQWKGFQREGIGVYPKQALVLTHCGGNTLQDLLQLAAEIQASVFEKFSVRLEIEPQHFP